MRLEVLGSGFGILGFCNRDERGKEYTAFQDYDRGRECRGSNFMGARASSMQGTKCGVQDVHDDVEPSLESPHKR